MDFFQIYNTDFDQVPLPVDDLGYGLRGLDLTVSSIGEEVTEHSIPGRPGNIITGVRDAERDISITARIKAMNATDFRLKRDRVFAFFKSLGSFYVTETQQGNKLMKVRVSDKYEFERPENLQTFGIAEIPLQIDGQPYWISRFKTMDIHNAKGIPVNGNWSFGMGLDVDPFALKYQFENETNNFELYNAGIDLKTIQEKGNCEIKIEIRQSVSAFGLEDSVGGKWLYNPTLEENWKLKSGDIITLNGHEMRLNGTPILNRTNRYYPIILSGFNRFRVTELTNYRITFDFRFKYY